MSFRRVNRLFTFGGVLIVASFGRALDTPSHVIGQVQVSTKRLWGKVKVAYHVMHVFIKFTIIDQNKERFNSKVDFVLSLFGTYSMSFSYLEKTY